MPCLIEISITGRVQGVGFRAFVEQEAQKRELHGYVKNEPDGTVHAEFVGPIYLVTEMVGLCRHGPSLAFVDDVTLVRETELSDAQNYRPFHISY